MSGRTTVDHDLKLTTRHCGNFSTCWYGTCSCGKWSSGPNSMSETVQAIWADHVYLEDIAASERHVQALLAEQTSGEAR